MPQTNPTREFTISDILGALSRHLKIAVGVPLVATTIAALYSLTLKPEYEARGNLEIGRVMEKPLEESVSVADRMQSRPFLADIAKELKLKKTSLELRKMANVGVIYRQPTNQDQPTRTITLIVTSSTAKEAEEIARAILEAVVAEHKPVYDSAWGEGDKYLAELEADLAKQKERVDRAREDFDALAKSGRLTQVDIAYLSDSIQTQENVILRLEDTRLDLRQQLYMNIFSEPTEITLMPTVPDQASGPHRIRIILIAFLISGVLGMVVAFFFDRAGNQGNTHDAGATGQEKKKNAGSR